MKFINRKVLVLIAMSAFAGSALVMPSLASAKTYKLTCKLKGDNPGSLTNIAGPITCPKPFGKGKQTGTLKIPIATGKWKFKGCSFKVVTDKNKTGKITGSTVTGAVSKVSKGTGKCKGIKGTVTSSGSLVKSTFTAKVKVSF
ncbi:MAG TPA: hypothetical protein VM493_11630 [Vicinamibacterales bacterium]|nr:hypothetical protein [Vicinamibacterales bacterium]